ncbi:helix-turn-helix transcriptional regulator [Natronosporangium hydrolyticum]|uniref:Helix-turn-helix transcriptional regulator n=1 Tax=Natronosporangium hydrolyticum TaxID=2811111 RepID=A0A895YIA1_9ACTN|nr:helix-turn-helix transcriptional regulator [Natronosporangium hydrolyticum]QSB15259.1 helix-turn-helix transcriptional regulator [Natronosporangium hydrolyticum]
MADTALPVAVRLRELRTTRGWSLRQLAARVPCSATHVHDIERGRRVPSPEMLARLDDVLDAGGALSAEAFRDPAADIAEATELAGRVAASDVSPETLEQLAVAVDQLATSYATTQPGLLLPRVRQHAVFAARLLDARATLAQRRELVVAAGWLQLLAATLHIDRRHSAAAAARLAVAEQLADHADHPEIAAWVWETRAWEVLTTGDYRSAIQLSQRARSIAPAGSSAQVQATAQEGRAWARLGDRAMTRRVLDEVARLAGRRPHPDRPEHHYQYDPAKARSYTATTLAWAGDPAAEQVAREVIAELDGRPRRVASARLDLALALVTAGRPDEAAATAVQAVTSGRVVASNWWRVQLVRSRVERSGVSEAADLAEVCAAHQPTR